MRSSDTRDSRKLRRANALKINLKKRKKFKDKFKKNNHDSSIRQMD